MNNLSAFHLSDEQKKNINEALVALEEAMKPIKVNLTPEERHRYGRVNEINKLFINKVNDYANTQPHLKTADVDWEEFARDFNSRSFLEQLISRLDSLSTRANNSKTLHDYDNYQDALSDYAFTAFRAKSNIVGFEEKNKELKQFFAKNKRNNSKKEENKTTD